VLPQYAHLLGNASHLVMLADASGCLLDSWGSRRFIDPRQQHGFSAGARWHEQGVGTNAWAPHWCAPRRSMSARTSTSCGRTATWPAPPPLFDAARNWSACSTWPATATCRRQTLGMVRMMSQSLENRLILAGRRAAQLIFNTGADNLDSPWAGLLVFDERGQVRAANHRADNLLGTDPPRHLNLAQLFQVPLRQILEHAEGRPFALLAHGRNASLPVAGATPATRAPCARLHGCACEQGAGQAECCWRRTSRCWSRAKPGWARRCSSTPCTRPAAGRASR
jgi:transcriptional regulator of acetoin/glycerol metabolism